MTNDQKNDHATLLILPPECESQTASDGLNSLQDPDDTSGRTCSTPRGESGGWQQWECVCVCGLDAVQKLLFFFCGTPGVEDRPSNYLHGRLLFLHRWVGCCCTSAARGCLSLSLDAPVTLYRVHFSLTCFFAGVNAITAPPPAPPPPIMDNIAARTRRR